MPHAAVIQLANQHVMPWPNAQLDPLGIGCWRNRGAYRRRSDRIGRMIFTELWHGWDGERGAAGSEKTSSPAPGSGHGGLAGTDRTSCLGAWISHGAASLRV